LSNELIFGQLNVTDNKGRKQGQWQKNFPKSEILQYKGQFKDNIPFGTFTYFYPSGLVKAIIEHNSDAHHSRAYFYFENKMLMTEGFYLDQKKDSTWVNYNEQGLIISVESFENDKLNGKRILYYLDGQVENQKLNPLSISFYIDDNLHGEYKEFFSTGKLKLIGQYENGKLNGSFREYYPNGNLYKLSKYKSNFLHGWSLTYDKEGVEISKFLYRYGEKLLGADLEEYLKICEKKGLDPNQ
jgi:antitoxin component YwqK of YwqJK toxin-antitoxin module